MGKKVTKKVIHHHRSPGNEKEKEEDGDDASVEEKEGGEIAAKAAAPAGSSDSAQFYQQGSFYDQWQRQKAQPQPQVHQSSPYTAQDEEVIASFMTRGYSREQAEKIVCKRQGYHYQAPTTTLTRVDNQLQQPQERADIVAIGRNEGGAAAVLRMAVEEENKQYHDNNNNNDHHREEEEEDLDTEEHHDDDDDQQQRVDEEVAQPPLSPEEAHQIIHATVSSEHYVNTRTHPNLVKKLSNLEIPAQPNPNSTSMLMQREKKIANIMQERQVTREEALFTIKSSSFAQGESTPPVVLATGGASRSPAHSASFNLQQMVT